MLGVRSGEFFMLKTKCYACQAEIVFPAGKDLVRCEFCTRMNDRPKSKRKPATG